MSKIEHKLEDFSFEKLEERKEFTFYYTHHQWGCAKTHHSCDPCPPPPSCPPPPPCGGGSPA